MAGLERVVEFRGRVSELIIVLEVLEAHSLLGVGSSGGQIGVGISWWVDVEDDVLDTGSGGNEVLQDRTGLGVGPIGLLIDLSNVLVEPEFAGEFDGEGVGLDCAMDGGALHTGCGVDLHLGVERINEEVTRPIPY